jgi:hypothetical protein
MPANGETTERGDWTPWVYLNVEWGAENDAGRPVLLTVNFGEHHLKVRGGRVWFGLSGGELDLKPSAGAFLPEYFWPENPLEVAVKCKRTVQVVQTDKRHGSIGIKAALATPTVEANIGSGRDAEIANTAIDVFDEIRLLVSPHGSPSHHFWNFSPAPGTPCLKGKLERKEIARMAAPAPAAALKVTFSVFKRDILPLRAEGLWPENVSPTKNAVVTALLRKFVADRLGQLVCDLELAPHAEEPACG